MTYQEFKARVAAKLGAFAAASDLPPLVSRGMLPRRTVVAFIVVGVVGLSGLAATLHFSRDDGRSCFGMPDDQVSAYALKVLRSGVERGADRDFTLADVDRLTTVSISRDPYGRGAESAIHVELADRQSKVRGITAHVYEDCALGWSPR